MGKKRYTTAQQLATYKYRDTHIRRITLDFNWSADVDILTWLTNQPNKTRAIKDALRPVAQDWNKKNGIITGANYIKI